MFPRLDDWYKLPVTAVEIADLTKKDKVLVKVYEHTSSGSPNHCPDPEIKPHWNRREDLYLEDGCLLCRRVVIPLKLQGHLLDELHECRPGMCRIKIPARSFVCWPGIDQDIEDRARVCEDCVNAQSIPKSASLLYWPWATAPWQRIHVDFAASNGLAKRGVRTFKGMYKAYGNTRSVQRRVVDILLRYRSKRTEC